MKFLAGIFAGLALYGFASEQHGGALLSLGMVAFVLWGGRQLDKRDAEFLAHPRSAQVPDMPAPEALTARNTEAGRDIL